MSIESGLLARRLRQLADEIESAERYGIPVPTVVSVDGFEFGEVRFAATAEEYDAWLEYAEAEERSYVSGDHQWRAAKATIGEHALPIGFATSEPIFREVPA